MKSFDDLVVEFKGDWKSHIDRFRITLAVMGAYDPSPFKNISMQLMSQTLVQLVEFSELSQEVSLYIIDQVLDIDLPDLDRTMLLVILYEVFDKTDIIMQNEINALMQELSTEGIESMNDMVLVIKKFLEDLNSGFRPPDDEDSLSGNPQLN